MRTVRLSIYGSDADLDILASSFPDSDPRVTKGEAGTYWMTSRRLDEAIDGRDGPQIYRCARQVLHWAVGAVRCGGLDCSTVRFIRSFDLVAEDGWPMQTKVSDAVELASGIPFSSEHREPKTVRPDPELASRLVQLAWTHQEVGEALKLLSYPVLDWGTLYKVYEVVRSHTPVETLTSKKWPYRSDLKAFTATANYPDIDDPMVRHAGPPRQPPKVKMSLAQARIVIPTLVRNWCDALV